MQLPRSAVAAIVLTGSLALTGIGPCDDIFAPCDTKEAAEKLDGIWAITAINNAGLPPRGYPVTSSEYLAAGSLDFSTRSVVGECKNPESYSGVVLVKYAIWNSAGLLQPGKTYSGTFDYNLKRQLVRFSSASKWIEGQKSGRTITVQGLVPDTWTQVSIAFTR